MFAEGDVNARPMDRPRLRFRFRRFLECGILIPTPNRVRGCTNLTPKSFVAFCRAALACCSNFAALNAFAASSVLLLISASSALLATGILLGIGGFFWFKLIWGRWLCGPARLAPVLCGMPCSTKRCVLSRMASAMACWFDRARWLGMLVPAAPGLRVGLSM